MNALELIIKILANATGMKVGFGDAEKELKGFQGRVDSVMASIGSTMAQVFGAFAQIAPAVMGVVTEANKMNTAIETLAVKIRNFNPELNKSGEEISDWANALAEGTKFIDDEVVQALDKAITKTGDYGAAQKVTADAVKLATVANIPLAQAADILSLAYQGNTRGLATLARQMGLNISEGANYITIMEKVNQGYQGMADVVAGDIAVGMKKLKDETSGYFEDIVKPNLPVLINAIRMIGEWVKGIVAIFQLAGTALGAFWGAIFANLAQYGRSVKALATGDFRSLVSIFGEVKDTWAGAMEQMSEGWGTVTAMWKSKGKPVMEEIKKAIAGIKSPPPIKIKIDTGDMVTDYINNIGDAATKTGETVKTTFSEMDVETALFEKTTKGLINVFDAGLDGIVDKLVEGGQSWEEWSLTLVREIEKVILKLLILKALTALLNMIPGGNIGTSLVGNILGLKVSPVTPPIGTKVSALGNMVVEVHTSDPSTYLRFRNSAITWASVGSRAKYIQKGPTYASRK